MRLSKYATPVAIVTIAALTRSAWAFDPVTGARELWDDYNKGGSTMHFILALAILAIAFAIERAVRLTRNRIIGKGLADKARKLWANQDFPGLLALCDEYDTTLSRVIRAIVRHRAGSLADVKTIADDRATIELRVHYRRLLPLTVAATLAPLLGLFGTVAGMIGAFRNFRLLGETGDPSVFAGDISLALITTAAGLIVAMPALALYHYFKSRTNAFADELEATISELAIEWFAPAPPERKSA